MILADSNSCFYVLIHFYIQLVPCKIIYQILQGTNCINYQLLIVRIIS